MTFSRSLSARKKMLGSLVSLTMKSLNRSTWPEVYSTCARGARRPRWRQAGGEHGATVWPTGERPAAHVVGHDVGVVHLHQVLLDHEVLAPQGDQVLLDGRAGRAVGVEAADAAVDLKGLAVEEAALDHIVELGLDRLELGGALGGGDGHVLSGAEVTR